MTVHKSDTGEKILTLQRFKAKDPYGYIETADYEDSNSKVWREIIKEIGDTTNIRLPGLPTSGSKQKERKRETNNNNTAVLADSVRRGENVSSARHEYVQLA